MRTRCVFRVRGPAIPIAPAVFSIEPVLPICVIIIDRPCSRLLENTFFVDFVEVALPERCPNLEIALANTGPWLAANVINSTRI